MHSRADKHIYGDTKRLFLNTELGCSSSCSYCYLPVEGLRTGAVEGNGGRLSARELLDRLLNDERLRRGPSGTLLSIGCYSECWDARNRSDTVALVHGLLGLGNPLQLATKRSMSEVDMADWVTSGNWQGQLSVYISSATLTQWRAFERGTEMPARRFTSFAACRMLGIRAFLYIKPVIATVTIQDVDQYGAVMNRYDVGAVVGERFESHSQGKRAPISSQLVMVEDDDVRRVRVALTAYGEVYGSSAEALRHSGKVPVSEADQPRVAP